MKAHVAGGKRKVEDVLSPLPIVTFSLREGEEIRQSQKRTRYDPEGRSQVQRVQKHGARLKCRPMKISVSIRNLSLLL